MDHLIEDSDKLFSISEAASFLGIHSDTLKRLDKTGALIPDRVMMGQRIDRRYTLYQLKKLERCIRNIQKYRARILLKDLSKELSMMENVEKMA